MALAIQPLTATRTWDLPALLTAADAGASRAERHTWLYRLVQWIRQPARRAEALAEPAQDAPAATPPGALRLRHLTNVLARNPEQAERVGALMARIVRDSEPMSVLADFGFAPRTGIVSEALRRLGQRVLPRTPDTGNLAELFLLLRPTAADAQWIAALDATTLDRLSALTQARDEDSASPGQRRPPVPLSILDAVSSLASAIHSAGLSPAMRQRMDPALLVERPFMQLIRTAERWRDAIEARDAAAAAREAQWLHALLARCRACALSVREHLAEHGVSVSLVYEVDQLGRRTERIADLMALAMAGLPGAGPQDWHAPLRHLLCELVRSADAQRSVRRLLSEQTALLSRKVSERSAATGEHYITRNRREYAWMLRAAAGGGAVLAGTTFAKFAIMALGLGTLWTGFWAGMNYAVSFLIVMALHFTVATKQPAMTAPAMAARLGDLGDEAAAERFVDEVAHLLRSQVAGIVGNLGVVAPVVLALQGLAWWLAGRPLLDEAHANYVLHSLTLLGPTALFAAFTGVLLFASSIIAGWAENAFVWHRLDSALAHNPAIVDRLGAERAARWAAWWRANVSGVVANLSLGLMLGLVPALLHILGLPIDVRHVTLSTGQLAAAVGTLGTAVLATPAFAWCVAGVVVTGVLNLVVSFSLALQVALRARGLHQRDRAEDRRRLRVALRRRIRSQPGSFLWPPADPVSRKGAA